MRALVPLGVVAVLCLTALLLVWTDRRRTARRNQLFAASEEVHRCRNVISAIAAEVSVQKAAGYTDWQPIESLIDEHRLALNTKDI